MRLARLNGRLRRIFGDVAAGLRRLLFLIASLFLLGHIAACFFHFLAQSPFVLGSATEADGALTWLATVSNFPAWTGNATGSVTDPTSLSYVPSSSRYIAALYYITFSLLSVGYGDVHATTDCALGEAVTAHTCSSH